MVLAYGVGVDYTLFLISRYREELSSGADRTQATVTTISKVGSAVAASAATGFLGIGMMAFASFGKLHQAGLSIALSLFVMLCAALTLTPALLRVGREMGLLALDAATARTDFWAPSRRFTAHGGSLRTAGNRRFRCTLAAGRRGHPPASRDDVAHGLSGLGPFRRRCHRLLQPRRLWADHRSPASSAERNRNGRHSKLTFRLEIPAP